MSIFLQQVVNGLTTGSLYALIALGYTMVYGIIRLINFAHGDLYMMGAFVGFTLLNGLGTAFIHIHSFLVVPLTFIVPMAVVGLLGVVIERVAYRPLRRAPRLSPLITAIGVSLALEIIALNVWGASFQVFPSIISSVTWHVGGAVVTSTQVVIFVVTVCLMAVLYLFVRTTMLGKAMRAIAIDQDTARLMGINVDSVISVTFFIGSALGAAAGIMAGTYYTEIDFNMGFLIGLKAFTAAVLGGIGNIPGAMLGGYTIGLLETLAVGSGVIGGEWQGVFVFAILILVLVFRPTGILGEHVVEKV